MYPDRFSSPFAPPTYRVRMRVTKEKRSGLRDYFPHRYSGCLLFTAYPVLQYLITKRTKGIFLLCSGKEVKTILVVIYPNQFIQVTAVIYRAYTVNKDPSDAEKVRMSAFLFCNKTFDISFPRDYQSLSTCWDMVCHFPCACPGLWRHIRWLCLLTYLLY